MRRLDETAPALGNELLRVHPVDPGLDRAELAQDQVFVILPFAGTIGEIGDVQAHMVWCELSDSNITGKSNERIQYILVHADRLRIQTGNSEVK